MVENSRDISHRVNQPRIGESGSYSLQQSQEEYEPHTPLASQGKVVLHFILQPTDKGVVTFCHLVGVTKY